MNILMMTNVYTPFVGGVTRSIQTLTKGLKEEGHAVLILAPEFDNTPMQEEGVIRVPSITRMLNGPFSLPMPLSTDMYDAIEAFDPSVVHAHHPFFLGSTALRLGAMYDLPVVYTHHTRYDKYGHYIKDSPRINEMLLRLADKYSELCDATVAPTESMADLLRSQGVRGRIDVVPTGIDRTLFQEPSADRMTIRQRYAIPRDAFVVGHVGRLSQEKNLRFLAESLSVFLTTHPSAHALVIGDGKSEADITEPMKRARVEGRLHLPGSMHGDELVEAYRAMDVFAFSSKSETQGIVLLEALASGVPVVALDAIGVRDMVAHGTHGILLHEENKQAFAQALAVIMEQNTEERAAMQRAARERAAEFSHTQCARKMVEVYRSVMDKKRTEGKEVYASQWLKILKQLEREWHIVGNVMAAAVEGMLSGAEEEKKE